MWVLSAQGNGIAQAAGDLPDLQRGLNESKGIY
jgi:hypothetical protein